MNNLITPHWVDIPEEAIYNQLTILGLRDWGCSTYTIGDTPCYYLVSGRRGYGYSLPIDVINRLANKLNNNKETPIMFDFQTWIQKFKDHLHDTGTIYNDAVSYGVAIEKPINRSWRVLGIHHLTLDENRGNHNVYIEMLCKQDEREAFRAIHWTWEGRQATERAPDVFAGEKPLNELVNLPLNFGMLVSVWTDESDKGINFSSNHPDELGPNGEKWNSVGHHSYFICFQEIDTDSLPPDPDPPTPEPPEPEPEPPTPEPPVEPVKAQAIITVNKAYLDTLEIDSAGNVTFAIEAK